MSPPAPHGYGSRTGWRRRLVDIYLVGWAAGATIASVGLLFRREDIAMESQWPTSAWQREIGFWNIILIAVIAQALLLKGRPMKLAVARAGVIASLLLGGNHLLTLLGAEAGATRLHAVALGGNALNLAAAVAVLATERRLANETAAPHHPSTPPPRPSSRTTPSA